MRTIATTRALDDTRGAVRVEDVYDTDIEDLWQACTTPERLSRWICTVSGEPHPGGTVEVVFTSTWSGPVRIDTCDAPHHLLVTTQPGTDEEGEIEVWLTADGPRTRLLVEDRGHPLEELHFHGAGWQVHLEDLARSLTTEGSAHPTGWSEQRPAAAWHERWTELMPYYRDDAAV
jgi:uncharacterized protein YndB with AHSA1/START domain